MALKKLITDAQPLAAQASKLDELRSSLDTEREVVQEVVDHIGYAIEAIDNLDGEWLESVLADLESLIKNIK